MQPALTSRDRALTPTLSQRERVKCRIPA